MLVDAEWRYPLHLLSAPPRLLACLARASDQTQPGCYLGNGSLRLSSVVTEPRQLRDNTR